ncbi:MAG: VTT domain-containing protein, partial [Planctomycetota bacterium]
LWRGLGPAGPLLLLATGGPLLGLLVLVGASAAWTPWFEPADLAAGALFFALATVAAACCLMPTHATSLLAGYLFGAAAGAALGFVVVLAAAAVGYGLFARLVGDRVLGAVSSSDDARRVHTALLGRSFARTVWLVALLRLSPLMPFAATNLMMAALGVRVRAFLCATALGIAPRSIGVALVGAQLSTLDWQAGRGSAWSTGLAVVATVLVIWWVGKISGRALRRETDAGGGDAA